ncbi:MAG: RnfABCDGE type electron transport complex subunit D [Pseudomonadota bacterium]
MVIGLWSSIAFMIKNFPNFPKNLMVGPGPHLTDKNDIPKIMWSVVIALMPALMAAWANFGWYAILITGLAVATAILTEAIIQKFRGLEITIYDGSAVVTGLLLAFILPPNVPFYIPIVGSAFAIGIVKHAFGGLGMNIWNPALAARAFLLAAYSSLIVMPQWPILKKIFVGNINSSIDAITQATPCAVLQNSPLTIFNHYNLWDLLTGRIPGSIGETSALALIAGGVYLIIKRIINWRLPLSYVLTVMIMVVLLPFHDQFGNLLGFWQPGFWAEPSLVLERSLAHAFSGGLIIGAFFMATDMVTSPLTSKGQVIFGIGCGLLVAVIRLYGGYPEGVCYSILIMNTFVWLIDRLCQPKFFGETHAKLA